MVHHGTVLFINNFSIWKATLCVDLNVYKNHLADKKKQMKSDVKSKVKPLSHQTALPQRLYSVLKPCQRAVGSPLNTPIISNLPDIACTRRSHSVPTASLQRPHDVPTASLQRPWRFYSAQAVAAACSRRAHGALTARTRRTHSVLTARTQRPHGDYSV